MGRKNRTSRHHLIPSSRGGNNEHENLVIIKNIKHEAFHTLFDNQTPTEQIRTLIELNQSALCEDLTRRLLDVLDSPRKYNMKCFKK